ncbi:uncharacterized protein LOC112090976 [Morus notabilis]|uniref:uncharacterized protein LOC112090976 n=1 Tax=Morus notabilis TaxID=981085 RepID=UPI000CED6E6A|nr:uncharacterized protein LOC112090976 [Morus notabilis]
MEFTYVLPGWEGSVANGRVLHDALRRANGLRVPNGCYYLVDAGYTNCKAFLAPFRGQQYRLKEWEDGTQPRNAQEYFNMKHSHARNVIERCFGLLNSRWVILCSPSFFPIKTQNRIILACCLLHNFIMHEMPNDVPDPIPKDECENDEEDEVEDNDDLITAVELFRVVNWVA